ncbi:hypothetical protein [Vulcanisaeta sp. JCM 14467]|uniref:hypothetical protein n=1 Tax=Vulcanisaeta sp. JCM 14467 TaxID=1295370 RepID=UPI0006D15C73|nr:hypothetical protein [Vulcanisaeta sp. JCM 14467]
MDLRIVAALVIGLLIVAVVIIHWLSTSSHGKKYEIGGISNNVNTNIAGNYHDNHDNVNYTTIMIERSEIAKNRHVVRLCNS